MTVVDYTVTVETAVKATPAGGDAVLDALADYHAAVWPSDTGRLVVVLTLPAESLRQAVSTGLALVEQTTGRAVTVEALPTDVADARDGVPVLPALVGVSEAAEILGVSRQRVLQLVAAGTLPAQRAGNAVVLQRAAVERRRDRDRIG